MQVCRSLTGKTFSSCGSGNYRIVWRSEPSILGRNGTFNRSASIDHVFKFSCKFSSPLTRLARYRVIVEILSLESAAYRQIMAEILFRTRCPCVEWRKLFVIRRWEKPYYYSRNFSMFNCLFIRTSTGLWLLADRSGSIWRPFSIWPPSILIILIELLFEQRERWSKERLR